MDVDGAPIPARSGTLAESERLVMVIGAGDTLTVLAGSAVRVAIHDDGTRSDTTVPSMRAQRILLSRGGVVNTIPAQPPSTERFDLLGVALLLPREGTLRTGLVWADTFAVIPNTSDHHSERIVRYEVIADSNIAQHPVMVVAVTGTFHSEVQPGNSASQRAAFDTTTSQGRLYYSPDLGMVLKGEVAETGTGRQSLPGGPVMTTRTTEITSIALLY